MASYLLTYLIHSTLLLGGALLVCGAARSLIGEALTNYLGSTSL